MRIQEVVPFQVAARRLASRFHPEKIILFGSQARGTADKHSDIDLLVIGRLGKNRINTMIKMNRLLLELDEAFDIMLLSPREYERDRGIPGTLARYASREGIVLYES